MTKRKYTLLLFIVFISINYIKASLPPVKLNITIDQEFTNEEQMLYWFTVNGDIFQLVDSAKIEIGQTKVNLIGYPQQKEDFYTSWLTFTKNGPTQEQLILTPGEDVYLNINSDPEKFTISGSVGTEDRKRYRDVWKAYRSDLQKLEELRDNFLYEKNNEMAAVYSDSIKYYKTAVEYNLLVDLVRQSKHPNYHYFTFKHFERSYPNAKNQIEELAKEMKERFPDDSLIQRYPNRRTKKETLPENVEINSRMVEKKFNDILDIRHGSIPVAKIDNEKLSKIQTINQIEDRLENLNYEKLNIDDISFEEIETDYILVDIWASWCVPCRLEIPYQKKVLFQYAKHITIYAISLDNNKKEWANTIEKDNTEKFLHVYGGNMLTTEGKAVCKKFGVKGIPANFLLDKNHKIIAINLRENELEEKMAELLSE